MNAIFAIIFTILNFAEAQQQSQGTISCYACATSELRSMWFTTGLAQVPDEYFTSSCRQSANDGVRESCSGPCMTWIFDNPDTPSGNNPYVVRGCHRTLTQVVSDRTTNMNGNSAFCEIDNSFKMSNSRGSIVNVRTLNELCNYNECNGRQVGDMFPVSANNNHACTNQTNDNLLNNAPLNCYDCLPSEGNNCHESKCTKKYCTKQQVKMDGGYQLIKSCTNVNLFGVDNFCQTYDVFTNQGGVPVKSQYSQCYCKDKQFCNSSIQRSVGLSILMIVIAKFYL